MSDHPCSCLICADVPGGRDADIVSTVRQHGWCALRVAGNYEFAYTVGLWHTFRQPELAMFGLGGDGMQHWLNAAVATARDRDWPAPGTPLSGVIDKVDVQTRPVDESWRRAFFGTARRFYQGWPVPVAQLVWPDAAGRWPWDDQATISSRMRQPFAWLPADDHHAGSWRLLAEYADGFPLPGEADDWALTTRAVLDRRRDPVSALLDGGAYDILDDRGYDADDLCVTYLGNLVQRHPVLGQLSDITDGTAVTVTDGTWHRTPLSKRQRAASRTAWKRGQAHKVAG